MGVGVGADLVAHLQELVVIGVETAQLVEFLLADSASSLMLM